MAIWDKVRQGIDKAGKAAQDVFDEGKLRIDAYRAREQADKAAEALGYAVFRAMESGHELESAARERLVAALREHENEAKRLEAELAAARADAAATAGGAPSGAASDATAGTASGTSTGTTGTSAGDGAPAAEPATPPRPGVDQSGASGQGGA